MKKFTANAVVFVCGSLMLTTTNSFAQTTTQLTSDSHEVHPKPVRIDTILEHTLVSVPIHKQISKTALPVTVLTGDELRSAATSTIGDTLSNKPGLANASFGPAVGQPVIRGQQGPRVSVMQNSIKSADASNISADHAVSIEPLLADSIEVLRGPATLLFGGGAIGGVVNVIDSRIPMVRREETSGGVEYRHDGASDLDVTAFRLDSGQGDFALHIDGLYREWNNIDIPGDAIDEAALDSLHTDEDHEEEERENTRGYVDNTGGRTKNLTIGGSYFFENGLFGVSVSRLENSYGIPSAGHAHHEDELATDDLETEEEGGILLDVEQTRYDSRLELEDPLKGIHSVKWLMSYTDYQHNEIEPDGLVGTAFKNNTWETRVEVAHEPIAGWHGVFGLQWRQGDFSAVGEESFIPQTDSNALGLFVVEGFDYGDWTYELGLRVDQDELKPDSDSAKNESFTSISTSASALWQINEQWQASVALSSAERAPVTEELYSNVDAMPGDEFVVHAATQSIEIGNPSLDSEQSSNIDMKLSWQGTRARIETTVFYNDFSDFIYSQNTGVEQDELPVLMYEQQDASFKGVEFEAHFTLLEQTNGQLELTVFGDIIRGDFDKAGDVPRLPPHRLGGKLSYVQRDWSTFISFMDAAKQDKPGLNETETAGYTRWDLGADYRMSGVSADDSLLLFVKANNITDEEIRLSTSFLRNFTPEAGRSIVAGLRYSF
ncbi:MAG: iron complex outermembrane receptor protein [Pseudohongiellaceae bacterium]|jgi:iron complex outermembrane receptor protein